MMQQKQEAAAKDFKAFENFTVDEFGEWARVSRATTYRAIRDGLLVAHKLRGRTIIRRCDAEKFASGSRMN